MVEIMHVQPDGFKTVNNLVSPEAAIKYVVYSCVSVNEKIDANEVQKEFEEKWAVYRDGHMYIRLDK